MHEKSVWLPSTALNCPKPSPRKPATCAVRQNVTRENVIYFAYPDAGSPHWHLSGLDGRSSCSSSRSTWRVTSSASWSSSFAPQTVRRRRSSPWCACISCPWSIGLISSQRGNGGSSCPAPFLCTQPSPPTAKAPPANLPIFHPLLIGGALSLASSISEVGVMAPQLANMALLYLFIGLLNRRSRRLGDAAARQVRLLAPACIPEQKCMHRVLCAQHTSHARHIASPWPGNLRCMRIEHCCKEVMLYCIC